MIKDGRLILVRTEEILGDVMIYRETKGLWGDPIYNAELEVSYNPTYIRNTVLMNSGNAATNAQSKSDLFYLYLVSNDDVEVGDWYYDEEFGEPEQRLDSKPFPQLLAQKIIASTNPSLNIELCTTCDNNFCDDKSMCVGHAICGHPQLSEEDVNTFIEGGVEDVIIKYGPPINVITEFGDTMGWVPQTRENHTIDFKPVKQYSRKELLEKVRLLLCDIQVDIEDIQEHYDDWEENL